MPTPIPKAKHNPALSPEVKRTLVMPAQADSTAPDVATLKTDFNSLLAKLRAAGILDS